MGSPEVESRATPMGVTVKGSGRIGGYGAVFDRLSRPLGGFRESVEKSFFNKSKSDGWPGVVCRFEHNPLMLLGTVAAGTLLLGTDHTGLDYTVELPESRSDVMELARRLDIQNSSFSFQVYQDDWTSGDGGYPIRHLVSGRLVDVAPTAIPAYPDATVGLRSFSAFVDAPFDDVLRRLNSQGELRSFMQRTDQHVAAPPTAAPAAELRAEPEEEAGVNVRQAKLELREFDPASALTARRARLALTEARAAWDDPPVAASPIASVAQARSELQRAGLAYR
jgi:HK97 family phage prohead protease